MGEVYSMDKDERRVWKRYWWRYTVWRGVNGVGLGGKQNEEGLGEVIGEV